ncbi:unnamed protein product [Ceutorhynchus assimilis]|uniref:Carboxylic ester hydrolase n=1 Tax=Ceutorhynchus assimilis TaxID=467358 RepID=A0A9N9QHM3_9CUCU|nr:unnamed protein product [Ceutorhynchus assimilis]
MVTEVVFLLLFVASDSLAQQVTTPDGPIRGTTEETFEGKSYYAYYSIPYAKPPIGSRRFLVSEPIDPWTIVHDGSQEKQVWCYQLYQDSDLENEDCLLLNVFTPQNPNVTSQNYPVMINIHGGGYISGSGLVTSGGYPKYLVQQDVIFVSFNYRLGVFGFLSTNDSVIPGNAGLSDQILALKWIQKNIASFGGDPNKVTILGQSAGGSSVGYLIQSPQASGLFSAAIMESGNALVPWGYQRHAKEYSFKTGSFVDSHFDSNSDSQALLNLLQSVDAKKIDVAALNFANWVSSQPDAIGNVQIRQGFYFAPVVDAASVNPIVPENQYGAIRDGRINKVPILLGICSEEGLMSVDQYLDYYLQGYDRNSSWLVPQNMHIEDKNLWSEVGGFIKQEYLSNSSFMDNKLEAIKFFTEQDFAKSMTKNAELQSQHTDVYFYEFSYTGSMTGDHPTYPGSGNVSHVGEYGYIFNWAPPSHYPENDQLVSRRMIRLWTNFAKYHTPTPTADDLLQNLSWPKVQVGSFNYVNIGDYDNTDFVVVQGTKPKAARMAFWDSLYEKYAVEPLDTY